MIAVRADRRARLAYPGAVTSATAAPHWDVKRTWRANRPPDAPSAASLRPSRNRMVERKTADGETQIRTGDTTIFRDARRVRQTRNGLQIAGLRVIATRADMGRCACLRQPLGRERAASYWAGGRSERDAMCR
jgi:hypothetical protein